MLSHDLPFVIILLTLVIASVKTGKLTLSAGLTGGLVAVAIFAGAGYTGVCMLAAFFILGTVATVWRRDEKRAVKSNNDQSVKRNSAQVMANGGVAAITGVLLYAAPVYKQLFGVMMAGSFAAAMADTLSSELGMVYGRRFYNILTLKKDEKGLDGVISLEGTLIGVAGAAVIAFIYAFGFGWNSSFLVVIIAGTAGNLADSFLGASLERRGFLNNNMVNFLNTLTGALVAGVLYLLI